MDLREYVNRLCERYASRLCLLYEDSKTSYTISLTFADYRAQINKCANVLLNTQVNKGEVVSVVLSNSIENVVAELAIPRIGAIYGPINPDFSLKELVFALNNHQSRVVITHAAILPKILQLEQELSSITDIFVIGEIPSPLPTSNIHLHAYFDAMQKASDRLTKYVDLNETEDPAFIVYTGGTTGFPKGVLITHFNLRRNVEMMLGIPKNAGPPDYHTLLKPLGIPDGYQFVNMLLMPMFHVNALIATFLLAFSVGGATLITPKFSASNHWRLVEKYRVSMFNAVPAMLTILLKTKPDRKIDTSSIIYINTGAAPLSMALKNEFEQTFHIKVNPGGLGLTETTVSSTGFPYGVYKEGSVGKAYIDTEIKIVNPQNLGESLSLNSVGEILLRGDHIMKAYFHQAEETHQVLLPDGWLRTGDLGYLDADGFLFLVGRSKDMIKRGGENVYPIEIESVISILPEIAEVAVIPIDDAIYGQSPMAIFVPKSGVQISHRRILEHCKAHLVDYKIPVKIEQVDFIPKTSIGKPDKKALVMQYGISKK